MMPIAIIAMILLGVVLLFLEVFVIPGITIAGIGGGILLVVGFFLSFREYGTWVGI
jgi:membrane-bound ClpP family serine protease